MLHRLVLCLLLGALAPDTARAWGERGHRLVGELAEAQLSPAARARVRELLAGEAEPSLAGVATWADAMRETRAYAWTAPLHYVRIHDRRCRYEATRDCRGGACVVAAITRYAARLGDPAQPLRVRREALKFVVHFVADVHQPLHSGHRGDKGGNEFQLSLPQAGGAARGTSLHGVWDYFVLADSGESPQAHATRLRFAAPIDAGGAFLPAEAVRWAETSCALTDSAGFYPERPGRLPAGYLERMRPLAERRLREAASELARLLEDALVVR
jgi:nuclease S1